MASPSTIRNTEQLRHAIDRGRGADKVSFNDPAAAPLGTDEEAAGKPPTEHRVLLAAEAEIRLPDRPISERHEPTAGAGSAAAIASVISIIAGIGAIAFAIAALAIA